MLRFLSQCRSKHTQTLANVGTAISASIFVLSQSQSTTSSDGTATVESLSKDNAKTRGIIETDFLDKIASKSYLNYHRSERNLQDKNVMRPSGVPETLRILVIDLPEFRQMFDEECVVDLSAVRNNFVKLLFKVYNTYLLTVFTDLLLLKPLDLS